LTEPFYRPRARVALGEYIEVMARSYNGPYHVYMLSAITCGVDLLGMMTTTPIWPSCLGHAFVPILHDDHSRSSPGQPPGCHTGEPHPWPIEGAKKSKEKNKIKIHLAKNSRERNKK
jgi:hypothetical protein